MGKDSAIEWCDHTFNPWIGCTKVSPACDHCYAERFGHRFGVEWGPHAARRRTNAGNWQQPIKWNREAERAGVRRKVFCASLADVFDNQVSEAWRHDLLDLIAETPYLDWLLLTKRPQNVLKMIDEDIWDAMPWMWLGTTVENQEEAERRIPHLLAVPAAKRFLSCEPLLGPIDFNALSDGPENLNALTGLRENPFGATVSRRIGSRVDWVIAGGESGPGARPMHPDWVRSLRDQCMAAGAPFFIKQWGEWIPCIEDTDGARMVLYPDDGREDLPQRRVRVDRSTFLDQTMARVGKKHAGAQLDGREWREVPNGKQ